VSQKVSIVFDTEAPLAFYLGEPFGKEVERRLAKIMKGELKGYLEHHQPHRTLLHPI